MNILLAGGIGFVGTHIALDSLEHGNDIILVDNDINSMPVIVDRIQKSTGKCINNYLFDIKEKNGLRRAFGENNIDCVIYFAGLNSTVESITHPIKYYRDNIDAILSLLECMRGFSIKNLVFTSSATVYGENVVCLVLNQ